MKRLLKLGQHRPKTSASALNASASVPASGFIFIDNSTGASATVAELSKVLGNALETIDLDGDVSSQIKQLMENLDQEASSYQKNQLETQNYPDWECSSEKAQLVSIAWKCASGVYEPSAFPVHRGHTFTQVHAVKPSAEGTVKAMTSTEVSSDHPSESDLLPLLVISIRGSAGVIDHMINANGRPKSAVHFITLPELKDIQCHSGFLNSAEALDSIVSTRIKEYTDKHPGGHILFTGHSAGGAVATILYLRQLSQHFSKSTTKHSCITFGAPPCLTMPFLPRPGDGDINGICINMINEFDLVTRVDEPYVLCVANLARLCYSQPPLPNPLGVESGSSATSDLSLCKEQRLYPMPKALYHHGGPRVVFSVRFDEASQSLGLRAVEVPQKAFAELLFCRLNVHRRTCYGDRVKALFEDGIARKTNR